MSEDACDEVVLSVDEGVDGVHAKSASRAKGTIASVLIK
jgi:hypothetical protein